MQPTKAQIFIIGGLAVFVLFLVLIFSGIIPGLRPPASQQKKQIVKLVFWGIDDRSAFDTVFNEYQKIQPNVQIDYRKVDPANYEDTLINALATNKGPDVLMVKNVWVTKHQNKLAPAKSAGFPPATLRQLFPTVAEQDFAKNNLVYALPLFADNLALIYNKDYFDSKSIALPPSTWKEFENDVPKLRVVDKTGKIQTAAAAIGGSEKSIANASDLFQNIMLQYGVQMIDADFTRGLFSQAAPGQRSGLDALNFYTKFSNPTSPLYTWNDDQEFSISNFANGKTAMIFGYHSQIQTIKDKNPFLNIGIAPMPQPDWATQPVTYANYWGAAVSVQSTHPDAAWDFIIFLTTNKDSASSYDQATKNLPALRSLISQYLNDSELGVFAKQSLTARSWMQPDEKMTRETFSNAISSVITGKLPPERALLQAEDTITSLISALKTQ